MSLPMTEIRPFQPPSAAAAMTAACRPFIASGIRTTGRRRFIAASFLFLAAITLFNSIFFFVNVEPRGKRRLWLCSGPRVFRRLSTEDQLCEPVTPYVTEEEAESLSEIAPVPETRSKPSHITLCQELVSRDEMQKTGVNNFQLYGLKEDEAVCMDWSSPHFSMMEIFASSLVGSLGANLKMTYKHDCARTRTDNANALQFVRGGESTDLVNFDYTTIQQLFPGSGLILDDGAVRREDILGLCKGCIKEFEDENWQKHYEEREHVSHHCLLYPGGQTATVQAHTYPEGTGEDIVERARRQLASQIPLASIMGTVQDRLQKAAASWRHEEGSPYDQEAIDGVIIPLDSSSSVLPWTFYQANLPPVSTIQILASMSCAKKPICLDHGRELKKAFQEIAFPEMDSDKIRIDIVASTAALFSRMILVKHLVIPPGTTSALLAALSKVEETIAIVAEDPSQPLGQHWFNFVRQYESNLRIVPTSRSATTMSSIEGESDRSGTGGLTGNTDFDASASSSGGSSNNDFYASDTSSGSSIGRGSSNGQNSANSGGASTSTYVANAVHNTALSREECVELRGRSGSWEMDYDYNDLSNPKNLQGSTARGAVSGRGFKAAGGSDAATWNDDLADCELDKLSDVEQLCEVMTKMHLRRIYFVGDRLQQAMVSSFLKLMGLDGTVNTDKDGHFVKAVTCKSGLKFQIVFTRNDLLDVQGNEQVVYPNPARTNVDAYAEPNNVMQQPGTTMQQPGTMMQQPGTMMQQPGTVMQQPGTVTQQPYNGQQCTCHPWVDNYQAAPMGDQRSIVVASSGYSQQGNYPDYVDHFNGYRHLAESVIKPDDILIHRTLPPEHVTCDEFRHLRQTMSNEDMELANRFTIQSIHEMRNTHEMRPRPEGHPDIHILDVSHMTSKHPHATQDGMRQLKCGEGNTSSEIHDGWNNLLFSMLNDIEAGERNQGGQHSQQQQQMNQPLPQDLSQQGTIQQQQVHQLQPQAWQYQQVQQPAPKAQDQQRQGQQQAQQLPQQGWSQQSPPHQQQVQQPAP